MAYLFLLLGIISLVLVFITKEWSFTVAVLEGILFIIFGLYEIFMPRK